MLLLVSGKTCPFEHFEQACTAMKKKAITCLPDPYLQRFTIKHSFCAQVIKCFIPVQDNDMERNLLCFSHLDEENKVLMLTKNECSQELCPQLITFIKSQEKWHQSEPTEVPCCNQDRKITYHDKWPQLFSTPSSTTSITISLSPKECFHRKHIHH